MNKERRADNEIWLLFNGELWRSLEKTKICWNPVSKVQSHSLFNIQCKRHCQHGWLHMFAHDQRMHIMPSAVSFLAGFAILNTTMLRPRPFDPLHSTHCTHYQRLVYPSYSPVSGPNCRSLMYLAEFTLLQIKGLAGLMHNSLYLSTRSLLCSHSSTLCQSSRASPLSTIMEWKTLRGQALENLKSCKSLMYVHFWRPAYHSSYA